MGIRSNNSAQSFFDIFSGTQGRASGASAPTVQAEPFTAKIVLVGGGGGGGIGQGAGAGGAGGVAFFDYPITIGTSYALKVGNGGRGGGPVGNGFDGEYSEWVNSSYRVGEGGNGGTPTVSGGNGNEQGGSGGGGGTSGGGGTGTPVPSQLQPYIFGGKDGNTGSALGGSSGGNQGGGGGGAATHGYASDGPGTPGAVGGGNGGAGEEVPSAYLPDAFTQTVTGPQPGQFLGMLTTQPAAMRRTFGGGGGGGAEHGLASSGVGGAGGGGHGGWGSPPVPASSDTNYPPAGPSGYSYGPNTHSLNGEPGYEGRGGGGGGCGYTPNESFGGGGGGGVCIIQSPTSAAIILNSIPSGRVTTYTSGGMRYHVVLGNNGTTDGPGTALNGSVSFGPNT